MKHDERLVDEFAAIWYAHDADLILEHARNIIAEYRGSKHWGYCTKHPWTCMRCAVDEAFKGGRELLAARDIAMKHDEGLVETVARAICVEEGGDEETWNFWTDTARAALDAIDASGREEMSTSTNDTMIGRYNDLVIKLAAAEARIVEAERVIDILRLQIKHEQRSREGARSGSPPVPPPA